MCLMHAMRKKLLEICLNQLTQYPNSQPVDLCKMVYQNEFGPGHLLTDKAKALEHLQNELNKADLHLKTKSPTEDIGFGFSRLHLHAPISTTTLFRLFELSAQVLQGSNEVFIEKIRLLQELCDEGLIPFNKNDFSKVIDKWHKEGDRPFSHSNLFRDEYQPMYRVVKTEYCFYLPLLARIDAMLSDANCKTIIMAIDGDAGSGKTTLGNMLKQIYDCVVIHADQFFLPLPLRTDERLQEAGGNIDYDRLNTEVIKPLLKSESFTYRPFDCKTWDFASEIAITPHKINIIEGSYSLHPKYADAYNLKVFLKVDEVEQMRRITIRNPDIYTKFKDTWIPWEKRYHKAFSVEESCDLIFDVSKVLSA